MTVTVYAFDTFIQKAMNGTLDMDSHTFKVKLTNNYTFDQTDALMADIGSVEIDNGNGYTTGGASLGSVTFNQSGGVVTFDAADVTWTASGGTIGPADGAIIYDDTAADDPLCLYIDFGAEKSAEDGADFKIIWNASGIFAVGPAS